MPSSGLNFSQLFGFPCTCPATGTQCPTWLLLRGLVERESLPLCSLCLHWLHHRPFSWFFPSLLPNTSVSTARNKKMGWVKGYGVSEKQRWGMWWQREQNWEVWGRNIEEEEAEILGMHVRLKCSVSLNLQPFQDRDLNNIIFVWLL